MKHNPISETIFYVTNKALALAEKIKGLYPHAKILKYKSGIIGEEWDKKRLLIFIMASGIAVRSIAPFVKDKKTDPAVIVLDEDSKFVISLLSGHIGGANSFALQIADFLKAQPVITTASDVNNLTAIDLWAQDNNLTIDNSGILPAISTKQLNDGNLKIYDETNIKLPEEFIKVEAPEDADILITNKLSPYGAEQKAPAKRQLYLRPKNIVIGIGCNSGTTSEEIETVISDTLIQNNLSFWSICRLATIDKKASEPGIINFASKYGFEIKIFSPATINTVKGIEKSEAVIKATGAKAVAEPAAILASHYGRLLMAKQKNANVTVAAAEIKHQDCADKTTEIQGALSSKKGRIYIVGTGPGSIKHITPYAQDAIKSSDSIVGYGTYLDLIPELTRGKEIVSTGMTQEIDRCKKAIELAEKGRIVSVISGGDPGIYAMAGLVFELLCSEEKNSLNKTSGLFVEVIPGISALNACAARLGAPLMHDFASISLSDRLTPWEVIANRLDAAASSDFVIVLYNPKSKGRTEHINIAASIILKYRNPYTPVGIVKQAMREGEEIIITDLRNLLNHDIDMQTTIIIGNSQTFVRDGWMITPRGYKVNAIYPNPHEPITHKGTRK